MYLPPKFKVENETEALELMRKFPFATLISVSEQGPMISHLPLVWERNAKKDLVLFGHLARANSHWKVLKGGPVTVVFHGPHTYIRSKWYEENDVPTWNYATIHIQGQAKLIEDRDGIIDCLKKLTDQMESGLEDPWDFWIPNDLSSGEKLSSAIVGFRISVSDMMVKFKLSQNRSKEDQKRVVQGLDLRMDQMSREISEMMKKGMK
jgi:transcriptional regulator